MISEPELVGDFPAAQAPETVTSTDGEQHPGGPHGRRPWLWAVGGAVAASAVWAGGLYAVGAGQAVDTRGYRVGKGLCAKAELTALSLELGKPSEDPVEVASEHSALDTARCVFGFDPRGKPSEDGAAVSYEVWLDVELHKKTDPEPEFEALIDQPRHGDVVPPLTVGIVGLGETALLTEPGEMEGRRLIVLDGGAVFDLRVTPTMGYGDQEPPPDDAGSEPEPPPLEASMIEDVRDLMAALKG
ncbi:hypothetical protein [Streptomyces enissocaesilis]|uniref:Uncharacterized protein n=1 Tax=Streptomyces enissocaesilis TaxID=332589 RepID=A0ABN3XG74_9ACTN